MANVQEWPGAVLTPQSKFDKNKMVPLFDLGKS